MHAFLPNTRFLSAFEKGLSPNMSDMSNISETMFSLSDAPMTAGTFLGVVNVLNSIKTNSNKPGGEEIGATV